MADPLQIFQDVILNGLLKGLGGENGDILYHDGTSWRRLDAGTNGHVLTLAAGIPSWAAAAGGGGGVSVAVIADQKTQFASGGTFTSGADRTRDLNTEVSDPDGIVTISSNRFSLGAGTYLVMWSAPAYQVAWHQSKLYDYTNSADVAFGSSTYASTGTSAQTESVGFGVATPGSTTEYEIRHVANTTKSTDGFGQNSNGLWTPPVYTQVTIIKVA